MKKTKSILFAFLATCALATMSSCNNDDDGSSFDGSYEAIENVVTPEILAILEQQGFEINEGATPPDLTGEYLASEFRLYYSNVPYDTPNQLFADCYLTFSNQNTAQLTTDFSYSQPSADEYGNGDGVFVSGSGDEFTAYFRQDVVNTGVHAKAIVVITGRDTADGITDFSYANFMVNNHGRTDIFIENGEGRIFYDVDALVERLGSGRKPVSKGIGKGMTAK